jgi:hypothetical protein
VALADDLNAESAVFRPGDFLPAARCKEDRLCRDIKVAARELDTDVVGVAVLVGPGQDVGNMRSDDCVLAADLDRSVRKHRNVKRVSFGANVGGAELNLAGAAADDLAPVRDRIDRVIGRYGQVADITGHTDGRSRGGVGEGEVVRIQERAQVAGPSGDRIDPRRQRVDLSNTTAVGVRRFQLDLAVLIVCAVGDFGV